jgi:hypothetical protein
MPIFRRNLGIDNPRNRTLRASNIVDVSRIDLPYPMTSGEISWDKKFEDFPSGSLTYTGLLVSDMEDFERAFDYLGKQEAIATIEGIEFYCQRPFSYERNHYTIWSNSVGEDIETITVTVGLVSVYEVKAKRKVRAKNIAKGSDSLISIIDLANFVGVPYKGPAFFPEVSSDSSISLHEAVTANARLYGGYCRCENGIELLNVDTGKIYSFRVGELLNTDGTNSLNPPPSYKDAELTWNRDPLEPDYELREPKEEVTITQDINLTNPPAADYGADGTVVLLAPWSSMFVNGGPTKTKTITKSVDGKTTSVEVEVYGYKFDSTDIAIADDYPILPNAAAFWQRCERTKTEYIYEDLSAPTYSVTTKDLSDPNEGFLTPIIHPDYAEYVSGNASGFSIRTGVEYLVQERTYGTKYVVLRREQGFELQIAIEDLAEATDPAAIQDLKEQINAYTWKLLPSQAIKSYILKNKRRLYRPYEQDLNDYEQNFVGNPFTLETLNYSSLPPRLKEAIGFEAAGSIFLSAPKYIGYDGRVIFIVPDLNFVEPFVVTEESYLKGGFFYALTPESLLKDADNPNEVDTTGEETYTRISRKILGKNRYKELNSEYSSQESGFERVYHTVKESIIAGQLPEGQFRKANWQDRRQKVRNRDATRKTKYFLESDYQSESTPQGESISFPTATSFDQAFTAAKVDLRIKTWQESNQSKKCAWYYPQVQPGDFIRTPKDLFGELGNWRLLNVSFSLSVKGGAGSTKHVDQPLVLIEGTTFNTGLDLPREIQFREEPDLSDRQPAEDDTRTSVGGVTSLGEIVLPINTRRNLAPPKVGEDPTTVGA